MLRFGLLAAIAAAFLSVHALASSFPSPPLYPSFSGPGAHAVITKFKVKDSTYTAPAAINAEGVVTGQYTDAVRMPYGFIREADGQIVKFGVPGAGPSGTNPTSINKRGVVAGTWTDSSGVGGAHGFVRSANGKITSFDFGGTQGGTVFAINNSGAIIGSYGTDQWAPSFLRTPDGTRTKLHLKLGEVSYYRWDMNAGTIAGSTVNKNNRTVGFVRTADGTVTKFNVEGAAETIPVSINSAGVIVGSYMDQAQNLWGFERAANGVITLIKVPGARDTIVTGIDDDGNVTGFYHDDNFNSQGFVLSASGKITKFSVSGAADTVPTGINAHGIVTGTYADQEFNMWGFVRVPAN